MTWFVRSWDTLIIRGQRILLLADLVGECCNFGGRLARALALNNTKTRHHRPNQGNTVADAGRGDRSPGPGKFGGDMIG
jgi:hypothetical protein